MAFARTKIRQPLQRAGALLPRPALEQAVAAALGSYRVVLLCAAAGYGKTATLVRALEQLPAGTAVAWVTVDEGDDLHRLLSCLTAALEPYDLPWRSAPEGLVNAATRPGVGDRAAVADEMANALDACDVAHGVIVFDDLHHVTDSASVQFLDHWLAHMSSRWTVAITARHDPPLRLARLRANGELVDFREAQLRFGADEVLRLAAGAGLDAEAARALHARTGGWAAGLRLALGGAGLGPGSAIDRQAFDFLATEVLDRIDPALREFLLLTSVLPELDAARCAAVSGDANAARRLAEIERLGLFAAVVDDGVPVLRLHDLFRDALQHRLRVERPEQWPRLLDRAAAVETDPVRRQALWLAAGQPAQAARALLASTTNIIVTQMGMNTVLQMCEQFDPAFARTSADLQHASGVAKWTVWETGAAERHLGLADALYTAQGDLAAAQLARCRRAVTLVALGRLPEAAALLPADDSALRADAGIVARLARTWHALESCRFDEVAPHFEALLDALEQQPDAEAWYGTVPPPRQTTCRGIAPALVRWSSGVLALCGDRPLPLRASALLTRGWVALWQGRLDDAAVALQRAEEDAVWTGHQVMLRHHAMALRALMAAAGGEGEAAMQAIRQRVAEHPPGYGDWGLWHSLFMACRVATAVGDRAAVSEWLQRLLALQPGLSDATPARLRPLLGLQGTLASLQGRTAEALETWRQALRHESEIDLLGQAAEVRVRLALALLRSGARGDAAAVLAPLLATADASPGGAMLAGDVVRELAASHWGATLDAVQMGTLQRWSAAGARAGVRPPVTAEANADAPPGLGPLSVRETEVLAQIAAGASNKLIARAMDLSPHTVKRHVANILDKLQLAGRAQATAWYLTHGGR